VVDGFLDDGVYRLCVGRSLLAAAAQALKAAIRMFMVVGEMLSSVHCVHRRRIFVYGKTDEPCCSQALSPAFQFFNSR